MRKLSVVALLWLLTMSVSSLAAEGGWAANGPVKARLISPLRTLPESGLASFALEMEIESGWKTYWKVPGAAGAPPKLDITSDGFEPEISWHWPAPEAFTLLGFQSYGYEDHVVLPFDLNRIGEKNLKGLSANATIYICNDICLPLSFELGLEFESSSVDVIDWPMSRLYNEYKSQVPTEDYLVNAQAGVSDGGVYLALKLSQAGLNPQAFIENIEVYDWPRPIIHVKNQQVSFWWSAADGSKLKDSPNELIYTYKDSLQSFSSKVTFSIKNIPEVPKESASAGSSSKLWLILAFAFLGGVILNIMPCVLPILSIKLMAWIELSTIPRREIQQHGLATAFGIITFFWLIAFILTLLKLGGAYIGWGIQFQNLWFLMLLILVMSFFLANLLGFFEFQLPEKLQARIYSVGTGSDGLAKSFLQGGTTTLLATPCSAPFLGTAVAFAFSQSIIHIWLIFSIIGVGLSLPYWVVILYPELIRKLPKPGPWMVKVKVMLSIGLALTIVWLLSLLEVHLNAIGISIVAVVIIGWLISLSWYKRFKLYGGLVFVIAILAASQIFSLNREDEPKPSLSSWETYSHEILSEHLESGHVVFIDVTADWCLTCKFNKAVVLESQSFATLIKDNDVVLMRADWTQPDKSIEALLSKYGRSAIPFNLVIGPNSSNGLLLPEVLTLSIVKEAIKSAI